MSEPDLFAPEALEDPYAAYDLLRRERPVFELPGTGLHLVTRHADAVEVLDHPEIYSNNLIGWLDFGSGTAPALMELSSAGAPIEDVLATADPPLHTRHRKLLRDRFAASRIARLEPAVQALVDELLDPFLKEGDGDWMEDFCVPLPVRVIRSIVGLPAEDDARLVRWSDHGVEMLSGVASPERMVELGRINVEFLAYLADRLREAQADPRDDALGDVARAANVGELSEPQATIMLLTLVIAGSESTTSLMGSAVRLLCESPGLQDALRADASGVPAFVEETLRLESPFRGHFRVTKEDAVLGGVPLPEGTRLMVLWGAVNRDPEAFGRPAECDLDRENIKLHMGFGWGIHFCLGAFLARLEARLALTSLLARTASFRMAGGGRPRHVTSLFVRRLERLPLAVEPA